jgi:hypothetical protein
MSCSSVDLEKQIVLHASRLTRVRNVRGSPETDFGRRYGTREAQR